MHHRTADLSAPRTEVGHDITHIFLGNDNLDIHDRLEQHRRRLAGRLLERHRAGNLESDFARVDIVPIDLTLIPAMYMLAKQPGWILHVCAWLDRLFCASPLRRWASGFAAASRRAA